MKRFICLIMIAIMLSMIGCPSETAGSQTSVGTTQTTVPNDNTKITSLQAVIDAADVGAEIDLSKYASIENFDYNAKINKTLTIQNGSDLKSAALTVVSDGVKLSGIQKASVTTNSSMKISGSSLSSLSIAAVQSSQSNASQIVSRGETVRSAQPPVVEVTDTTVVEDVSVGIANAYLNVKQFTAKKAIELGAANVQLTISDKATNIKEIKTDKICQVILEDGTSDTIPCSLDKISVTGSGELKQIDMTVKDGKRLIALTPVGGLTTAIQKDESIDFSTAVVLGTYQQTDGVAVFTAAGLSYNFTETFSKLEKDFIVKINEVADDDGLPTVPLYRGGENQDYDWSSLSAGKHKAVIELVWDNRAEDYAYNFVITVIDGAAMPTFTLSAIKAEVGANVKTIYYDGEPLGLWGLLVWGTYASEDTDARYSALINDYELDPPNGTILNAANNAVTEQTITVKSGNETDTIKVTVKPIHTVKFMSDGDVKLIQSVMNGGTASELTIAKLGYTLDGWYAENVPDTTYDFSQSVTEDITLIAKWTANQYIVTLCNDGDVSGDKNVTATYDTIVPNITIPSKVGYTFGGYYDTTADGGVQYINASGNGVKKWDIAGSATLYAKWNEKGAHSISYRNTKGVANISPTSFKESKKVTLPTIDAVGYTFAGWSVVTDVTSDETIDGWSAGAKTDDVTLWARWTPNTYTIKFDVNGGEGSMNSQTMTYDVSDDLSACTFSRTGYTFEGWATDTNGEVVYTDGQNVKNLKADNGAEITLSAKWTPVVYNIIYDNTKDAPNTNDTTYDITRSVTLQPLSKPGWRFDGWYKVTGDTTADTTTDKWNENKNQTGNVTFRAGWTANTYTIKFDANGGMGSMNDLQMTYDTAASLTANSYSGQEHYKFKQWNTHASGDGTSYTDKQSVSNLTTENNAEITLYAIWEGEWYLDASGDFVCGETKYAKTALKQVLNASATITCDQSITNNFDRRLSAFPSERVSVTLGKYAIGKYEVTQQLYAAVIGSNPSYCANSALGSGETSALLRPVEKVSWYDAIVFCNKLSLLMGKARCYKLQDGSYPDDDSNVGSIPTSYSNNTKNWSDMKCDWTANGYRLPTECEWECAARGGTYSETIPWTYQYSGSDTPEGVAWYDNNSKTHTWEVGLKNPNTLGLYDMSGNVGEWCWDIYDYNGISSDTPVTGVTSGSSRLCRDGDWHNKKENCYVYNRGGHYPYYSDGIYGFRLACSGE